MIQVFNFSAGPAMLPEKVLKLAQKELCNWNGLGVSVMEINHRSDAFVKIVEEAETNLRDLLNIPSNYKVLFCIGGGRGQFASIPLNLLGNRTTSDYINTGYWAISAVKEAYKYCTPNIINVKTMVNNLRAIKPMREWKISNNAAYMHYCPNETIDGIAIHESPVFNDDVVVVADCSSSILSTSLDVNRYGIIYAGAQKNIGPAGMTLVIIREDLLGKAQKSCPSILNYTTLNNHNSMFNTPPTFSWYLSGLVFKWLKEKGGVVQMEKINLQKANLLYNTIDTSNLYHNNIAKPNRSYMNIPFHLENSSLNDLFLKESFSIGLHALKGHRAVGGMRASIYNAMPIEGVKALTDFMIDFERRHG